jgi:hypothetical protein
MREILEPPPVDEQGGEKSAVVPSGAKRDEAQN